jgi:TonB family protein
VVESSVNAKGEVTDAHVVSGPDELRNAALTSVLTWHFSPDGGLPPTVQSSIRFETAPKTAVSLIPLVPRTSQYLKSINLIGLSDELAEKVSASLPVHVGDTFENDDLARVKAAVKGVDEHLDVFTKIVAPDATLTIMLRRTGEKVEPGVLIEDGPAVSAATAAAPIPPPADGVQRLRVGGNVESANLIRKVTPLYPPLAKQARIQGVVRFTALISAEGNVISLQLVEGHPLLVESAQDAVRQWQYKPTLLNGNTVEVITQIDVNYTLSQ